MGLKELADSRGNLLSFDPRRLKVKPDLNARDLTTAENIEHLEWLAADIARVGVLTPLTIFLEGEDIFIANGHCRLAATMLAISRGADIQTVPCLPEVRGTNDLDRVLSQNSFNSGKRLSPLEQGANFKKALALGADVNQIAVRVGKSVGYVNQMIDFQSAPAEVHALVKEGKISTTLAAKVVKEKGGTERLRKAVKTAEEAGKPKVTERDLPPKIVPTPHTGNLWEHKKGGVYKLLNEATLKIDETSQDWDDEIVIIYKSVDNGELFVRPKKEFFDGRFVKVDANA